MNNKKFQIYLDFGSFKLRAGAFNKKTPNEVFYAEQNLLFNNFDSTSQIKEIISSLEKDTNEYVDDINLMIDDAKMLSIGISVSKKFDGSKLKNEDVQFLIQDAKQQVLKSYPNKNIAHIIITKYRIDDISYITLPDDINCNKLIIEANFICLPKNVIHEIKKLFLKQDISIDQILSSSYTKASNYKNNFEESEKLLFIDMGFNKTSITCYDKNEFIFFEVLPVGGNHITKDISKILDINLVEAELIKLNFDKEEKFLNEKKVSLELIQKIIFSRIEEILELSIKFLNAKTITNGELNFKIILMGEGSKILDNRFKEKISFSNEINLLDESTIEICSSGFKSNVTYDKQEVVLIPKNHKKKGFFEKLFHFFESK